MTFLQSLRLKACLIVCMTSLFTTTLAKPLNEPHSPLMPRSRVGRTLLWEWTLSRDVRSNNQIKATADSLADLGAITSITNWETWRPLELPSSIPFRPMVRTLYQLGNIDWNHLLAVLTSQKETIVHFYSEPDLQNISPEDAVRTWKDRMLPLRKKYQVKLVSPSCVGNDIGSRWLDTFMSQLLNDEKPDYLGLHFYTALDEPSGREIEIAKEYFRSRHEKHNFPVIISELASTSRRVPEVIYFSKAIASWLETQDWVFEYGFFGVSLWPTDNFVSPAAQLLDSSGRWTYLGKWFVGAEDDGQSEQSDG